VHRRYIPDVVLGDLDSVEESVVKFYQSQGTVVINQSYDQDTNDLHKVRLCLRRRRLSSPHSDASPRLAAVLPLNQRMYPPPESQ
jgi:hypothetical protein